MLVLGHKFYLQFYMPNMPLNKIMSWTKWLGLHFQDHMQYTVTTYHTSKPSWFCSISSPFFLSTFFLATPVTITTPELFVLTAVPDFPSVFLPSILFTFLTSSWTPYKHEKGRRNTNTVESLLSDLRLSENPFYLLCCESEWGTKFYQDHTCLCWTINVGNHYRIITVLALVSTKRMKKALKQIPIINFLKNKLFHL